MFHTYRGAELLLPSGLGPDGVRSWTWMELSISMPIFLAAIECRGDEDEGWSVVRNLWFTSVSQVIDAASQTEAGARLIGVELLSPGYVNNTGAFKLDSLHHVWRHTEERNSFLYVLKDGRNLSYSPGGLELVRDKLELVLSV